MTHIFSIAYLSLSNALSLLCNYKDKFQYLNGSLRLQKTAENKMKKTLSLFIIVAVFLPFCSSLRTPSLDQGWKLFKNLHGKQYNSVDEEARRTIWEENGRMIQKHNLEADLGLHTFTMKVNQFADLVRVLSYLINLTCF